MSDAWRLAIERYGLGPILQIPRHAGPVLRRHQRRLLYVAT